MARNPSARLLDAIIGQRVAVDTGPFIYWMEDHQQFAELVAPVFAGAEKNDVQLVTSTLTLMEVLVLPLRLGRTTLAKQYVTTLRRASGLELVGIGLRVAQVAAMLRARHGVATPDAIHLATAVVAECKYFLTNDRRMPEIPGLRVLQLTDYLVGT